MGSFIRDRSGRVLFSSPESGLSTAELVKMAALEGVSLAGASLRGLDMRDEDISQLDLTAADLTGARFSRSKLSHVNLTGARLDDCDLSNAFIKNCFFSEARAVRASFAGAAIEDSSFFKANLHEADFATGFISGVSFVSAQMSRVHMKKATLEECDMHSASMGMVAFESTTINLSDFSSCHMKETEFRGAHIANTRFDKTDLRHSAFENSALVKCSFVRTVFTSARLRFNRFDGCRITEARMHDADLIGNRYANDIGLTPEMHAEKATVSAVKALSPIGSKVLLLGAGLAAAAYAPPEWTAFAKSHLVGQGAIGIGVTVGAAIAQKQLGPLLYSKVVKRLEAYMARSAHPVSSMAAKLPIAAVRHTFDDLQFAFTTGLSERRIVSIMDKVSKKDENEASPFKPLCALFGKDQTILVARDKRVLEEVQRHLAAGKESVFVARLDENGVPRAHGPALYEFERSGGMKAVWYHNGRPDFAIAFAADGSLVGEHAYSGREALVNGDGVLRTHILSRGETTRLQAMSWLMKPQDDMDRVMVDQPGMALLLRESSFYLKGAAGLLGDGARREAANATRCAETLDRVGSSRGDNLSPHFYANNVRRAGEIILSTSERLRQDGLYAYAARGDDLAGKLGHLGALLKQKAAAARTTRLIAPEKKKDGPVDPVISGGRRADRIFETR